MDEMEYEELVDELHEVVLNTLEANGVHLTDKQREMLHRDLDDVAIDYVEIECD